jgi:tyrosyl-tRNA synthetase
MADEERRIPYRNMIYLGDGITDVPCMKLVKQYGGQSIAIYQKKFKSKVEVLLRDERVNFICEADYTEGSELDEIIKLIIKKMSVVDELSAISVKQRKEMEIE